MEDNILDPEKLWIGGRCYRINPLNENRKDNVKINYEEEFIEMDFEEDDCLEIEAIEGGSKFQLKLHVPQQFYGSIIGTKGTTKKRIEQETSCQLIVPKQGSKDSFITIKGFTRNSLLSAKHRLELIVMAGRSKQQSTHFLSVAFTTPEIKQNFLKFQHALLNDPEIYGLDESLFQNPEKLHLTIAMLVLLDNEDRALAAELLQECKEFIIDPILRNSPLKAKLCGLNYMNDDPSSVDVLYGTIISDKLQEISNAISNHFVSHGLTQSKTNDSVKLHVTLLNSQFRDSDDANDENNSDARKKRTSFDASKILNKYRDFYFGEILVSEIHLSQRFSKSTDGYYGATGILKLN